MPVSSIVWGGMIVVVMDKQRMIKVSTRGSYKSNCLLILLGNNYRQSSNQANLYRQLPHY
jgi:hypothetical protein